MLDSIASMLESRFSPMKSPHSVSIESGTRRNSSRSVTTVTAITIASTASTGAGSWRTIGISRMPSATAQS